jgi:hypothetical protein
MVSSLLHSLFFLGDLLFFIFPLFLGGLLFHHHNEGESNHHKGESNHHKGESNHHKGET